MIAPAGVFRLMDSLCGGPMKALIKLYLSGSEDNAKGNCGISKTSIEELEKYQNQLSLIEALEVRMGHCLPASKLS